jgi:uncharacterized cysteine cluster protein YcgN (CxxCxxCC family)
MSKTVRFPAYAPGRSAITPEDQLLENEQPFWKAKSLDEMTPGEWEALCDGCGRCCLVKLEDADTGEIVHTRVACRLLDIGSCRCTDYAGRRSQVPDCVQLTSEGAKSLTWLPETCAYRLIAHGEELPWWHPLVAGDADAVHEAGVSVRAYAISERKIKQNRYERYLLHWE